MTNNKKQTILIATGEASGDKHGAQLIEQMRAINPNIEFLAVGSDHIRATGAKIVFDDMNALDVESMMRGGPVSDESIDEGLYGNIDIYIMPERPR